MQEPSTERFPQDRMNQRLWMAFMATRPAFLTASILPVLVAGAFASTLAVVSGVLAFPVLLLLALLAMVLIHSGANVLNDYFDALNGSDTQNTARIFPFTGGSRFIQNNLLSMEATRGLGIFLMGSGCVLGAALALLSFPLLLLFGLVGGMLAVLYSAPSALSSRGFGDIVILLCFGVLPVMGTVLLLSGSLPPAAWGLGGVVGCFAAAILWANSIPDIDADRLAGKWTLPARLGHEKAAALLPLWFIAGFFLLLASPLPHTTWIALLAAIPAIKASIAMRQQRYIPALPLTIVTHAAVCLLLIVGLLIAGK